MDRHVIVKTKHIRLIYSLLAFTVVLCITAGILTVSVSALTDRYLQYPLPESTQLLGKTVIIDPGHGIDPNGYGAGGSAPGYIEHTTMMNIARLLEVNLIQLGANVILTRTTDQNTPLSVRVSIINKYALQLVRAYKEAQLFEEEPESEMFELLTNEIIEIIRLEGIMQSVIDNPAQFSSYYNDPYDYSYNTIITPDLRKIFMYCNHPAAYNNIVYISLHSNAPGGSGGTGANGVDVYISTNGTDRMHNYFREYSAHKVNWSNLYATLLLDEVTAATGMRRNNITDAAFYMTRETNVPGVLIELGFHTNPNDRAKLQSDVYRRYMANAIALATLEYFRQTSGLFVPPPIAALEGITFIDDFIFGLTAGMTVTDFLSLLSLDEFHLALTNNGGIEKISGNIGTGDILLITDEGVSSREYTLIILGDVTGNGEIALLDMLMIQRLLLTIGTLEGYQYIGADVNRDGVVTLLDMLMIQRYLLGLGALD